MFNCENLLRSLFSFSGGQRIVQIAVVDTAQTGARAVEASVRVPAVLAAVDVRAAIVALLDSVENVAARLGQVVQMRVDEAERRQAELDATIVDQAESARKRRRRRRSAADHFGNQSSVGQLANGDVPLARD